jgi:hypothetical protein
MRTWCGPAVGAALLVLGVTARADTPVAVLGLAFKGEVPSAVRTAMTEHLGNGLTAAGLRLVTAAQQRAALGDRQGSCAEAPCWKGVAAKVGCRYVVGGSVTGEDRNYDIALWMGDAASGTVAAWVQERCDICGLAAAAEKMDLTASALAAKLIAVERAPARVSLISDPPGAKIFVDGAEVGTAPRELELAAGKHELVVRAPGYLAALRTVTAIAGVQERMELRLLREATSSPARVVGWVGVSAGIAAIATGIALLAINGQSVNCPSDMKPSGLCARKTNAGGGVALGLGAAVLGVGGYFLYRGYRKASPDTERAAALSRWRFSF